MKIQHLVAFQAVRIGTEVVNSFSSKDFDIIFRDPFFRITRRNNGDSVLVPIHNVPYLKEEVCDVKEEATIQKESKGTRRSREEIRKTIEVQA